MISLQPMHEPSYRDEDSQCSSWDKEWAWWSWLSKYASFSNDWLPLVKANRLLPHSLPSFLDIKEIIFHMDSENRNGCFLTAVVFLLPSKRLLKAYVKFAGWRWVGLKPDLRTTDNWAMSSCYLGLSGKLLWISVGAWVRGCVDVWVRKGRKHTRCTDAGIIAPLSSPQHHKSPWQHTFCFAFGNYHKIETACMLSTRQMSKSKADAVVLVL